MKKEQLTRRKFLKNALGFAAGAIILPAIIPSSAWSRSNLPGNRITLGFIGVGKQGYYLLRGFLNTPGTQVLAVCDVDQLKLNRAKETTERFYAQNNSDGTYAGCAAYRDYREVLARQDIDAVVIGTPDHWHALQAIQAASVGKDVFCEKPLSLTIAEGRKMADEARRCNIIFQTGSMQRSDSRFRFACELVQNGYIGEVKKVRVSIRTGFISHPIICDLAAEKVPAELDWDSWLGPAPKRPYNAILSPPISFDGFPAWRDYRDYSGGGMTDWGAHHFDIAQWGLGMDRSGPVEIHPADGRNFKYLTYKYASGVELTGDFESNVIIFTGTEGEVEVNRSYLKTRPANLLNQSLSPSHNHLYDSKNHLRNWIDCIHTRQKPITDVEIGHRSVTVCHLGNIATELKRPLKWNPEKEIFADDPEANRLLNRSMRSPWSL
jgi:predicted dehydrogenase